MQIMPVNNTTNTKNFRARIKIRKVIPADHTCKGTYLKAIQARAEECFNISAVAEKLAAAAEKGSLQRLENMEKAIGYRHYGYMFLEKAEDARNKNFREIMDGYFENFNKF